MTFNQPVSPSLSFRGFRHRANGNPHGWGLAAFPDRSALIFKEPIHAEKSRLAEFVRDYTELRSQLFIGHVRYGNIGGQSLANTHPFCREFRGQHVVFAHNGTLRRQDLQHKLNERFTPVGQTDSEHALCVLLTWMVEEQVEFPDFTKIETRLQEMNELGTMNILLSDGNHLFAYHDANGYNGLFFTQREAPFSRVSLKDEDWEVDLSEEKRPDQRGCVIATKPLTDEQWTPLQEGLLCVFKNGQIVYPTR